MSNPDRRDVLKAGVLASTVPCEPRRPLAEPIRVGQIGVGHAHATKMSVYRASADYDVVGIVEPNARLREQAQKHPAYRGLKWMTEEQLLNTAGLQVVLVETQIKDLLRVAETCVRAGKHIHLDKPAGDSLSHLQRIFDLAQPKELMIQLGYMYRYNPAIVMLRDFLKRGWLGEVFEIHTVMSKVMSAAARRPLAEWPGGTMFELGCHLLDLVVGVLGKPAEVTAFRRHTAAIDDDLQDNMLAVLGYPKALATVKSTVVEVEGFARRHFVVCGTEGTFHIQPLDNPSARVAFLSPRGEYKRGYQDVRFPRYTRYVDDAADMARVIRGEKASDFPPQHDLAVQETVLKASGVPTR